MDLKKKYEVGDPEGIGTRVNLQASVFAYNDGSLKPEDVAKQSVRAWYGPIAEY